MRTAPWSVVLALSWPLAALAGPSSEEVADTREAPAAEEPVEDLPAVPAEGEGVWSWMERLDGEVPDAAMLEAVTERVDADLVERAQLHEVLGLDVPLDFYRNPERAFLGDPLHLEKIDPREFDIPIVVNAEVEKWMRLLLGPSRKHFQKWLERRSRYEALIHREADAVGLPRDLLYLSMIESGFNPTVQSSAAAVGLWQFIQPTGRMYGLTVDYWVDERRDPERATKASLKMLGDLHRRFGDWYLAWAAYNTGPARVARNVDRLEDEGVKADFWTMLERDMLHSETSGYVPKIVAAAIIGKHPERYGFTNLEGHPPLEHDTITLDHAVDLAVIAECAGIDEEALRTLNPALRRYALPEGGFYVHLPKGTVEAFQEAYAKVPPEERRRVVMHVVRSGESLSKIAARYGVSMAAVASANRLRNVNALHVGQQLVIPMAGGSLPPEEPPVRRTESTQKAPEAAPKAPEAPSKAASDDDVPATYTVRPGDALSVIAERYGVGLSELVALNGLRSASSIQVGQVLKLRSGGGGSSASPSSSAAKDEAPAAKITRYTVRSGDTLSQIAERFGVSMAELQKQNGIGRASAIQVGQVLTIEASTSGWTTHTVKKGESLGIIAERYGVSLDDLRAWNGLNGSTIYPGDTLKLRKR